MTSSLAAIFEGQPGQLVLRQVALPSLAADEILIRVLGCTLCGSDLHSIEGRRSVPIPTVLGHEIVGEIADFGSSVARRDLLGQELQVGDRVTWAIVAHCGVCFFCQRGLPQKCLQGVKYGHEALRPGQELRGGLAEHCLLAPGTSVIKLSASLPLEVVCPASCATATIAAAIEAIGQELRDRSVCVFGAGMLGLTACAMLRSRGAAFVTCVDPLDARRQLASKFGATHLLTPTELTAGASCHRDELPYGYDAAIEVSGHPSALEAALPMLRIGGTLVLVGSVFPTNPISVLPEQIVRRQLTLRGIHNYAPRHLQQAIEFLTTSSQSFPFADLVTQWVPLAELPEQLASKSISGAIRVGVRPE